ncbi:uncharacterized protein BX664DRAFT_333413 [Halteromyces radiatus]|uniref:uncharacterized protein n=1 Tax=Halteromyces radiatus TaxID=101107 RepID=UPI00221FCAE1|nr:uncharacterized protein BX664DRAFT_333413 [Halteromyces radiatus]KAI8089591.1 hypothetical protein BX664DRAFT_333413 [Halteromyces radiatus]
MDYEDSFPSAPVRYAFDDSDDDIDSSDLSTATPPNNLSIGLVEPLPQKPCTLVLGVHAGASYLNALNTTVIGHITSEEQTSKTKTEADISTTDDIACISFPQVEAKDSHMFTKLVFDLPGLQIEKVILLDSFVSTDYTNHVWGENVSPPFLRVLQTSSTKKIPEINTYEAPNLVKDLSAALLAHCEMHGIPCYAFFSLQESLLGKHIITKDTCTAYSQGLDKLGIQLPVDKDKLAQVLKKGSVDEHHHRLYL